MEQGILAKGLRNGCTKIGNESTVISRGDYYMT